LEINSTIGYFQTAYNGGKEWDLLAGMVLKPIFMIAKVLFNG